MRTQPDQKQDACTRDRLTSLSRIPTIWILVSVAVVTLAADQATKSLIRANLAIGESWPREGFFRITHGTNTGTAFGLFPNQTLLLTIASIFAIGLIIYFYRAHGQQTWLTGLNVGLLLGGAFGNLIDRLVAQKVTDFIDVGPWPIFNIADSAVVVGITLLIASMVLFDSRESTVAEPAHEESSEREPT
jgi:signal peptidase II